MIRAVLDTSSLVPAELRRQLQEAAALGEFTAIWSPWIVAELNRVLTWRWIKDPPPGRVKDDLSDANEKRCGNMAKRMMELLLPVCEVVTPLPPYPSAWITLTDPWDQPIWAAVVLGRAQYVTRAIIHPGRPMAATRIRVLNTCLAATSSVCCIAASSESSTKPPMRQTMPALLGSVPF